MLYKLFTFIAFICAITFSYAQPTYSAGDWEFKIKKGCRTILFNLNSKDSIYYDTKSKYQLTMKCCNYKECFSFLSGRLRFEDEKILFREMYVPFSIVVEVKDISNNRKMVVEFKNVKDTKFSTEFKFKKGEYTVNIINLLDNRQAIRKKGYKNYFIRQRYYRKKNYD